MLDIKNLNKTYPNGIKALDNLNLQIKPGMFGLLGPNGAGKSSLMRTIATLQQADEGRIHFGMIDVFQQPMELRKTLGYLPQSFGVYPGMSAHALLHYFATLKGVALKKDRNLIVDRVLELTNLSDVKNKHVSGYSGGMKQRFGIAQLLLNNPTLLIVDEPTAGLDPAERNRFLNVLREIGAESTVIFSTHIVEDVKELCTDMAILNAGKILSHIKPVEATLEIENKIWVNNITRNELEQYESQYLVLSSSYNDDNSLQVRVYADQRPNLLFEHAKPSLEDVYFIALLKDA